jgi:integrase
MTKVLPKGVTKLPPGIDIHGRHVRIAFSFMGQRCREPLRGYSKITKSVIAYAENKRRVVLDEIKEGRFDYAAHFPESAKALLYSGHGGDRSKRTVAEGVETWLKVQAAKKATSTIRNYRHKAAHVTRKWPRQKLSEITKSDIELFQSELLERGLSPKTVNDIFTIVRGVWSDAFHDGVIKSNPLDRVKNIERDESEDSADPFNRDELERIAKVKTFRQQDINMIMVACWCGLSLSELIALSWGDVDTKAWTITVRRAKVGNEYKVPKERSRVRVVELIEPAVQWLKRQMEYTAMLPAEKIAVRQRDNVTTRGEEIRLVFLNGKSRAPWYDSSVRRWFSSHLRLAGVRHRGPNQCRHTFASQALSAYVPLEWVARQLGHSDNTMVKRHYGRWIPKDTKSMALVVSNMMGFGEDSGGLENAKFAPILPQNIFRKRKNPDKSGL